MIRCKNCGAFIHEGENNACFVCGHKTEIESDNVNINANTKYNINNAHGQNEAAMQQKAAVQQDPAVQNINSASNNQVPPKRPLNITEQTYENNYENNYENSYDEKFKQLEQRNKQKDNKRSKKPKLITVLAIVLTVMVVLVAAGSLTSVIMYNSFNKAQGYTQIKNALINSDIETLKQLVYGNDIEVTDAGLNALCREFSTEEKVEELFLALDSREQTDSVDDAYSAISLLSEDVFLGYSEYKLQVNAVEMVFATDVVSAVITMDGVPVEGNEIDGTYTYENIFPGQYTVTATAQTIAGQSVQGEATSVSLLNTGSPYAFNGGLPITDITVSGCVSDDAAIYVNDVQVAQKPQDKKVSLPQVLVGSNIKAVVTTQNGATATSVIQFADKAVTELAFIDFEFSGGDLPIETLDNSMLSFYASYVEAKNTQDVNKLVNVTESYKTFLSGELSADVEKQYDIDLTSTKVKGENIKQYFNDDGEHCIIINAQADYERTGVEEDAKAEEITEYLTVQMVYTSEGTWAISRVVPNDVDNHNANTFSPDIAI